MNKNKETALSVIEHWISTEFLTQASMSEPENAQKIKLTDYAIDGDLNSIFDNIPRVIAEKIISIPSAYRRKKIRDENKNEKYLRTINQVIFGKISRKLFLEYFLRKHPAKIDATGIADDDFISFAGRVCKFNMSKYRDTGRNKVTYDDFYSKLFVADHYLDKNKSVRELDSNCYFSYEKDCNKQKYGGMWGLLYSFISEITSMLNCLEEQIEDTVLFEKIKEDALTVYLLRTDIYINTKSVECLNPGTGLDSYFIYDLEAFRDLLRNDDFGKTQYEEAVINMVLNEYKESGSKERIRISPQNTEEDESKLKRLFSEYLDVSKYPVGKWPGEKNVKTCGKKIGYQPYLMQQLAVNLFENNASPIFTVNGPPGTGKTTLLKETVADIITRKVKRMADILIENDYCIDNIFEKYESLSVLKKEYRDLYDYGIVVASETNAAVENITREFPRDLGKLNKYREVMDGEMSDYLKLPVMAALGKNRNFENYINDMLENMKENPYYIKTCKSFWDRKAKAGLIPKRSGILKRETNEFLKLYKQSELKRQQLSDENKKKKKSDVLWKKYSNSETYKKAQLSNPGSDYEYDFLREELFIRAWRLHQLIAWSSQVIRCYFSMNLKEDPASNKSDYKWIDPEEKPFIYNSIFFVSPVVSTTFASMDKMFEGFRDKGLFGVLIVDEAGQVLPQDAVGALMRARRALIVGDPKQIPPVVLPEKKFAFEYSCPKTVKKKLLTEQTDEMKRPDEDNIPSLQRYADEINPYGTVIGNTWVGCPLVIHTRCISPMFEISNELSHDGTMINLTYESKKDEIKKKNKEFILDSSYWIQVKGKEGLGKGNHFVKRQGGVVLKMILEKCRNVPENGSLNLFVITPFVSVANGLYNTITEYISRNESGGKNSAEIVKLKRWIEADRDGRKNIGTIHTFQGKETDEVIILLGCCNESRKSVKAAKWIFRNMINVAVSRAKYRVYIVGDMEIFRNSNVKTADESPVNKARKILNRTLNEINNTTSKEYRLGLADINEKLSHTESVGIRREKTEYICPLCKGPVRRDKNVWFCDNYNKNKCKMKFIYFVEILDTRTVKNLTHGKGAWFKSKSGWKYFHPDRIDNEGYFIPDDDKVKKGKKIWKPDIVKELKPKYESDYLHSNCSTLIQRYRKNEDVIRKKVDYFDLMILDAIYTIQYIGKKTEFNTYDILKYLTGMKKPDPKSKVRAEIEKRIKKMTKTDLAGGNNKKYVLLPHIEIGKDKNGFIIYRVKEDVSDTGSSFLYEYLNSDTNDKTGKKINEKSILKIPVKLIDGRKVDEKEKITKITEETIFPINIKWLKIKYYIMYRIAYMYKVKNTSHIIDFSNMEKALELFKDDFGKESEGSNLKYRYMEMKRFREKMDNYLNYLKTVGYIKDYNINPPEKIIREESGYCGIQNIEINPK